MYVWVCVHAPVQIRKYPTIMFWETFPGERWTNVYSPQNQWQIQVNVPTKQNLKNQWVFLTGLQLFTGAWVTQIQVHNDKYYPSMGHYSWNMKLSIMKFLQYVQADQHAGEFPPGNLADCKDFLTINYCFYYLREGPWNLISAFPD